jgi:hypothetical protein
MSGAPPLPASRHPACRPGAGAERSCGAASAASPAKASAADDDRACIPIAVSDAYLKRGGHLQNRKRQRKTAAIQAIFIFEPVAQSVEHVTFNHGVQGSNPCGLTRRIKDLAQD